MKPEVRQMIERGEMESKSPQEVVRWALEQFGDRVALASSFGAEDVAIIHMMVQVSPTPRIFTLDTGRLNQETYDVMDQIREKYHVTLEVMFPKAEAVERMVREKGLNLFYQSIENRKLCCGIRKVEPLNRALASLDAWITGLRRDQVVTRSSVKKVDLDADHGGIAKINPLADWSWEQVMAYVKQHGVPYNVLHDRGYPSIGCAPCTRAVKPGEDFRAGRWWWERPEQKECGLHVKHADKR
ncbi:MAG: phosphoadenylyl-sulfate reductase [Candidatus Omnitrophota bacterium]|nr:phosphoadenylyl-sulfate reductase [Candidatus Omnitrophota bacterium]